MAASTIEFTGERFVPACAGEIAYEHWHRYALARGVVRGKRVLDVASGEGYGAALLATTAREVHGLDLSFEAVAHAQHNYTACDNLRFTCGSCTALPYPDASFEVIVSFETIEHIAADAQIRMLDEFRRVLTPDGMLVLSSPNKAQYSDARGYHNEFHVHELYRAQLAQLLAVRFPAQRWLRQRVHCWSMLWNEAVRASDVEVWALEKQRVVPYTGPEAMYLVVVAAAEECHLAPVPSLSLLTDRVDSVLADYERATREAVRLDDLLGQRDRELTALSELSTAREQVIVERERLIVERDAWLVQRQQHIEHLEHRVAERDTVIALREDTIAQRERALNEHRHLLAASEQRLAKQAQNLEQQAAHIRALDDELRRQHALIMEREAVIAYRQRWKWWLQLPWFRVNLLLSRLSR